jgi:hypothetical protein
MLDVARHAPLLAEINDLLRAFILKMLVIRIRRDRLVIMRPAEDDPN